MKSIKLFGLALEWNNFDYNSLLELWLKTWYLIDQKCSTKEVYDFLSNEKINLNSTFYKNWNDVTSKNRFELFIDQIKHYASTYWTDHAEEPFVPNEDFYKEDKEIINFKTYKFIKSATKEEIIEKCNDLLKSWIALEETTINDLFEIYDKFNYLPDIEIVKNKEAKMKICFQRNILPSDTREFIRFLLFVSTWDTLLIQNRDKIEQIISSKKDLSEYIIKFWLEKLSEQFLRHKNIFLAIKKSNKNNISIVNKLKTLSKKNHKPSSWTFFENLLNWEITIEKIEKMNEKIKELNSFKKVSLIEAINRKINNDLKYNSYIIRNWKFFINEIEEKEKKENSKNHQVYKTLANIIYDELIEDIKSKYDWKSFFIPEHLDIKVPKSEKTFIWNFPMWTEISLPEKDLIIWINWREEDWTRDFDLSLTDKVGNVISWNSSYYSEKQDVIYSWDVTSANPEATELLYFNKNSIEGLLKINRYSWQENSLFTLFVASENSKIEKNKMVSKENVLFQTKLISDKSEKIIWIKSEKSFIFQKIISWNKRVSTWDNVSIAYLDYVLKNQKNLISFKELLLKSWLTIKENNVEVDFDFSDLKKDDIITFLSN